MALENVNSCPICKGHEFKPFNTCTDHTTSREEFTIVQCQKCNFLITSPRPDSPSLGKYYQSDTYISHTNSSKSLIDRIYKFVRSFTLKWKLDLIQKYKANGTLLDYGCGTGEFLNICKNSDWECFGVEPSRTAREKAEQLTNTKLAESLSQITTTKFDVITLWHVLEHIENLTEKLSELKSRMSNNGIIFIAVPNHESLDGKKYKADWAGYDVPRHLWHFSQKTMTQLLTSHGLKLEATIPMKMDSFYVSLLSEKYQNPGANIFSNALRAFATGIRSNVAAKADQNYSSLVYIARA